jgi:hypothetical protein
LVFPFGYKKFALFKFVEKNNRFKKQHFLNRVNKITDLKSASKGVNQKNKFCRGVISKKIITGGKAKLTYFAGGKDLLTQNYIV